MKLDSVNINDVTPMMRQYMEIKLNNKDIILFYRLGDFYEMFFEDAHTCSKELELTLTGKNAGLSEKIPMCGVPFHSATIYIDKLVERGYKVGICEQLEEAKNVKGLVKRGIVQIISSGTNFNYESLNEKENNYIGAVIDFEYSYCLAYTDITTGEIKVTLLPHNNTKLVAEIISTGIKELIINNSFNKEIYTILKNNFKIVVSTSDEINNIYENLYQDLKNEQMKKTVKYLLTYIKNTQFRDLIHLQKAVIKENNQYLKMDMHTKRNLELTETLRLKQRNYSLIWLLDKTKTAMGSRMLKQMIENPLIDIKEINKRYDIVDTLLSEFILTSDLQKYLLEVYDLERLSGKIAFGSANARDLLQLKNSIKFLPHINSILKQINYTEIEELNPLYNLLENSIYENPPISLKEGYLIKDGYNEELDELKNLRKGGKDFLAKFENEEKEKTGIKNLKVGYNRIFGYYIEVSKGNTNLIKEEFGYERKQTLSNCERYINPILKEKEALILNAEEKIIEIEYELFNEVKEQIKSYIPNLQKIAKTISEIDCLQSFSAVATQYNFTRPKLNNERDLKLIDNRHPVVEEVLVNKEFVPNDIIMDKTTDMLLITGPNMAGKSTFMRQLAITVIMAQIGCFVPAKEANMPVFDAIYTRIGASDDLVSGESTFMVEMVEANNAISNATENSLVIFDELGRGTATFDGMSLAQAIIEHIHDKIKCKTLFSTHYHELTDLDQNLNNLKNVHVSAYEEDGNITFLHKIKEGSVDKSYGIHVAKLAHLPESLIKRADQILTVYENKEKKREMIIQQSLPLETEESKVEEYLKTIDVLNITPMQAMKIIAELKEMM